MRISFYIDRDSAIVGTMYYLSLGIKFNTKKRFKHEITEYFRQNGHQCIDDHESENEEQREEAELIVDKYFKN